MTAELIDSHAHLDDPAYDADRDEVLARARAAGVRQIVVIGSGGDVATARRAIEIAERDPICSPPSESTPTTPTS